MKEVLCLYNGCFFFVYDYWPLFEQKIFFYNSKRQNEMADRLHLLKIFGFKFFFLYILFNLSNKIFIFSKFRN